jgi:hypothetical protein
VALLSVIWGCSEVPQLGGRQVLEFLDAQEINECDCEWAHLWPCRERSQDAIHPGSGSRVHSVPVPQKEKRPCLLREMRWSLSSAFSVLAPFLTGSACTLKQLPFIPGPQEGPEVRQRLSPQLATLWTLQGAIRSSRGWPRRCHQGFCFLF